MVRGTNQAVVADKTGIDYQSKADDISLTGLIKTFKTVCDTIGHVIHTTTYT